MAAVIYTLTPDGQASITVSVEKFDVYRFLHFYISTFWQVLYIKNDEIMNLKRYFSRTKKIKVFEVNSKYIKEKYYYVHHVESYKKF